MDKIARIRQKVKELQDEFISIQPKDCSLELIKSYAGYAYLDKVLSFLDTLSEKADKSLEEEIDSEWKKCNPIDEGMGVESAHIHIEAFDIIARHFTEWQYQRDREEFAKIKAKTWCEGYNEGLIKGAASQRVKLFEEGLNAVHQNNPSMIEKTIAGVFVKYGMDRMKEEMLKDAVEGEVYKFGEVAYVKERNNAELTKYLSQFNNGDKVRIVVLKEEEE